MSGAMDFLKSMAVAAAGMRVQSGRMRVISENIANADSTASTPGGDPYRRRIPTFRETLDSEIGTRVVALGPIETDSSEFHAKFEPGHPAADPSGMVKYPNVNALVEMVDMREAQRAYDANVNVITATRAMIQRTLDILRS
jgi:flagellar basal-body rod protein FlgC